MGSITCIAWKGDTLVLGDMDGNLNFWDLKGRVSRYVSRTQVYYLAETKNLDIVPLEACHLAIVSLNIVMCRLDPWVSCCRTWEELP